MTRAALAVLSLAACGGDAPPDLVVTSRFTLTAVSGTRASPLDPYVGQELAFELTFADPAVTDETVGSCRRHTTSSVSPPGVATGPTADIVRTYILERLPGWDATLELCDDASASSVSLFADNNAGLGVSLGCLELPASANAVDGAGNPRWTAFAPTGCDGLVYDQLNERSFGTSGFVLAVGF